MAKGLWQGNIRVVQSHDVIHIVTSQYVLTKIVHLHDANARHDKHVTTVINSVSTGAAGIADITQKLNIWRVF